ncbi:hypothetical protein ABT063_12000 [Streptomyces sp. NPDC002838]|uniref:hypothetical protein n=1 Tax=Streptomyces sp. NPDC002838 TaxID=3154436 RepID=UPI003317E280
MTAPASKAAGLDLEDARRRPPVLTGPLAPVLDAQILQSAPGLTPPARPSAEYPRGILAGLLALG